MKRELVLGLDNVSSAAELIERCSRVIAGPIEGVEWSPPAAGRFQQSRSRSVLEELAESPAGREVKVTALAQQCDLTDVNEACDDLAELLARAAALGVRCLNLAVPPLRRGEAECGFARYQDMLNFTHELLQRIRLEAESSGVAVALEAAAGGCLLSPVELRELIDVANSWAVGACVDVGRVASIGSAADWLTTLTHRVHSVRLPDVGGHRSDPPGHAGTLDGHVVAAALDEIGYERMIILPAAAETVAGRAHLARLGYPVAGP